MNVRMDPGRLLQWPSEDAVLLVVTDGVRYNEAVRQVTEVMLRRFPHSIYLTSNRPFHMLRASFGSAGVETSKMTFVDCVSGLTGVMPPADPQAIHIESPTLLEKAAMRAEQALRRQPAGSRCLIVDSLSTLSVYNGSAPVSELAHNLITRLRLQRIPAAFLLVERQAGEELLDVVKPLCDGMVRL
jgi:hypothetical protein